MTTNIERAAEVIKEAFETAMSSDTRSTWAYQIAQALTDAGLLMADLMNEQKEYRVVHELGPQYASPAYFLDLRQAQQMAKSQKQLAEKIGMGHTADGWHIESRPIMYWQKVETTDE